MRSDFLWVSTQVPPRECPVVIIQNTSGEFLGTKSTCGVQPVSVGNVPKILVNRRRSPVLIKSSTPDNYSRSSAQQFDKMLNENLLPIAEIDDNVECRSVDSEFDQSVDLLAMENKVASSKGSVKCDSAHSSNDVEKGAVHLNIKDIGNDTSVESVLNHGKIITNTKNNDVVVKSVGGARDVSGESGDLNDSIDYKSVDEEITKGAGDVKTEISAADRGNTDNIEHENDSTLTASQMTHTDDEQSVTIPPSSSTDGSTVIEKSDVQMEKFFPDSDEISTANNMSLCAEDKHVEGITDSRMNEGIAQSVAEITDEKETGNEGNTKEEIIDNRNIKEDGDEHYKSTVQKKIDTEAIVQSSGNVKSKGNKKQANDKKTKMEKGIQKDGEDASTFAATNENFDLSVKIPTIHSSDSDYSEDNEEPLALSEIPTTQLDTTVESSSDEDNEYIEKLPEGNTTVDEANTPDDNASKGNKKK